MKDRALIFWGVVAVVIIWLTIFNITDQITKG